MSRMTSLELQNAVTDTIARLGNDVAYQTLSDALTEGGYGAAVPMLRSMKHQGLISMWLSWVDGEIEHIVSLAADVPF